MLRQESKEGLKALCVALRLKATGTAAALAQEIQATLANDDQKCAHGGAIWKISQALGAAGDPGKLRQDLEGKYSTKELHGFCGELRLQRTGKKQDLAERIVDEIVALRQGAGISGLAASPPASVGPSPAGSGTAAAPAVPSEAAATTKPRLLPKRPRGSASAAAAAAAQATPPVAEQAAEALAAAAAGLNQPTFPVVTTPASRPARRVRSRPSEIEALYSAGNGPAFPAPAPCEEEAAWSAPVAGSNTAARGAAAAVWRPQARAPGLSRPAGRGGGRRQAPTAAPAAAAVNAYEEPEPAVSEEPPRPGYEVQQESALHEVAPSYGGAHYGKAANAPLAYGQAGGQPPYGQPGNSQPQYANGQPSYGQPDYSQPGHSQLHYGQQEYGQPVPGQPAYELPAYVQPAYEQPAYGQPTHDQPAYSQASWGGDAAAPLGNSSRPYESEPAWRPGGVTAAAAGSAGFHQADAASPSSSSAWAADAAQGRAAYSTGGTDGGTWGENGASSEGLASSADAGYYGASGQASVSDRYGSAAAATPADVVSFRGAATRSGRPGAIDIEGSVGAASSFFSGASASSSTPETSATSSTGRVVQTEARSDKQEDIMVLRQRRFVERRMKFAGYMAEEVAQFTGGSKERYLADLRRMFQGASDESREAYLKDKLETDQHTLMMERLPKVLGPAKEIPEFGAWHSEPVLDQMEMIGELGPARQAWCKWWDQDTGCGELVDLDDQSPIAAVSAALTTGANVSPRLKYLHSGEFVEYRRVERGAGLTSRAVLVRGLKGWPLMCEVVLPQ